MEKISALETKTNNTMTFLLLIFSAFLVIRILPILKSPLSTYGYDYGLYLYAYKHAVGADIQNFFTGLFGGYDSPLFYLAQLLKLPPKIALDELFFAASFLLPLTFYLLFKKINKTAAVFAAFLATVSMAQAEIFHMFLWKTALALPLVVLAAKFLREKKYKLLVVCSIGIFLLHRTTGIIYLLSLILYGLWQEIKNKHYLRFIIEIILIILGSATFYYVFRLPISNFLNSPNEVISEGLFFENQNPFIFLWPMLVLGLFGVWRYFVHKQGFFWLIFTALSALWIIFQLPFYHRIVIYLDLGLITFAAYGLSQINYTGKAKKIALAVILGFLFYQACSYAALQEPLITKTEISEIENFRTNPPGQFVLATSAQDGPWLLGFSTNVRLAAPGLFEDRFTYEQWQMFWHGQDQTQLLYKYPRPLYLYQRSYQTQGPITSCLKQISENFYEYSCP